MLCMFVPKRDGTVHVLLPKTDGHASHGVPGHQAKLHMLGAVHPLEGWTLDLAHLGPSSQPRLPEGILNFSHPELADRKVNLSSVHSELTSRVILGGGCISHCKGLGEWYFKGSRHPDAYLANWVTWTAPSVAGKELEIFQAELDGGNSKLFATIPVPNAKTLKLRVHYLPPGDSGSGHPGRTPDRGWRHHHFSAYLPLFEQSLPDPDRATPRFKKKHWRLPIAVSDSCIQAELRGGPKFFMEWGRTFSCFTAGAEEV